jgi:AcrR family transcriptional regulator
MENSATLADRRNDFTRRLIVDGAIDMMEKYPAKKITVRASARQANISERTVFRYFPSRDDLLDAVAQEMRARLKLPPSPASMADVQEAPRKLYSAFEANANLTKAGLNSEISSRMRGAVAKDRWVAVAAIIDDAAPQRGAHERKIAAANVRYLLSATAWHYYRFNLGCTLEESIDCAETAINLALAWVADTSPS